MASPSAAAESRYGSRSSRPITAQSRLRTTWKRSGARVIRKSKRNCSASIRSTNGGDPSFRNRARAPARARSPPFDHEHEQGHDYEGREKNEQKQRRRRLTTYELLI